MKTTATTVPVGKPGLPACVWCGEPVAAPRWNYKRVDAPGPLGVKNNIHQKCRVRRAREERAKK